MTLTCSPEELERRLITRNDKNPDTIKNSIDRLSLYEIMDTIKIDTSSLSIEKISSRIIDIILDAELF